MNEHISPPRFVCPDALPVLDDDPFGEAILREPAEFRTRLREAGPVVWLSRYGFYATGRFAEAEQILSDWRTFTSSRGIGVTDFKKEKPWREPAVLLESDPPRHNEIRLRAGRVLAPRAIEALAEEFEKQAGILIDRGLQSQTFDIHTELAQAYPLKVFGDALGIDDDKRDMLLVYGDMGFNNFGPNNELLRKSMERGKEFGAIDWMMKRTDRNALRPGSLGDQFHGLTDDGYLTPAEAWNVMRGQLTAGVDTTIATLGHLFLCLAQDPQAYAALREEPDLIRNAFEEAVRHLSPLQVLMRTTTIDSMLGGAPVRADTKIMIGIAAANRDPRRWDNPDKFDIRRNTTGHLGFGRGVHVCMGMHVAKLEAECLMRAFLRRVKKIELAGEPVYRLNNTVRSLSHLPVRIEPA